MIGDNNLNKLNLKHSVIRMYVLYAFLVLFHTLVTSGKYPNTLLCFTIFFYCKRKYRTQTILVTRTGSKEKLPSVIGVQ